MTWSAVENKSLILATLAICIGLLLRVEWINTPLFYLINTPATLLPDALLDVLTLLGDSATHILIVAWVAVYRPKILLPALIFALVSLLLTGLLKDWFDIARPAFTLGSTNIHINGPTLLAGAFPSGHSISTAAMALLLYRYAGQRKVYFWLAGLVIIARVLVGAHWPADILAGAGIGVLLATLAIRFGEGIHLPYSWIALAMHWFFIGCSVLILTVTHGQVDHWLAVNLLLVMLASWLLRSVGLDWRLHIAPANH